MAEALSADGSPPPEPETPASCPGGEAEDPPPNELEPSEGLPSKSLAARLNHLRHLMKRYPRSAKLRLEAATLSLGPPPAGNPVIAQEHLEEALALHERGCRLPEPLEWAAREKLGLAQMLQGDHAAAVKTLRRVAERWPAVPQTHYDLACALCRLDRLDDCLESFTRSLDAAASPEGRPEFVDDGLTAFHYVHQSRRSADLAPLRSDPRYQETIAPHLKRQP